MILIASPSGIESDAVSASITIRGLMPEVCLTRWDSTTLLVRVLPEPGMVPECYPLAPSAFLPDGGYEYGVRLASRPVNGCVRFSLQTYGLEVLPQAPLTVRHADGSTGERSPWGSYRTRPAYISGGFAFYGAQSGNFSALGGYNYKAGRFGDLHRPWIQDASGRRLWCDQALADGVLTIRLPTDVIYPAFLDPTFGYTSHGISGDNSGDTITAIWNKAFGTPASSGTLDSVTAYVSSAGTAHLNPALYSDASGVPASRLAFLDSAGTPVTALAEYTQALSYGSLTSGVQYQFGISTTIAVIAWKFDTTGGTENHFAVTNNAWPASAGSPGAQDERVSVWGNFTASGGGAKAGSSLLTCGVGT